VIKVLLFNHREAIPKALGSGKFTFQSLCTANMMRNENVHQELGNNFFFSRYPSERAKNFSHFYDDI
jgi:hypothetical protein